MGDTGITLNWITSYLADNGRYRRGAVLVVDYVDSTGRKSRSASQAFELTSSLFHNLLAMREGQDGAVVKATGDGCIVCFPFDEATQRGEACLRAVKAAVRFHRDIGRFNTIPGRREEAKIYTKSAVHVGDVYMVDYGELYGRACAEAKSGGPMSEYFSDVEGASGPSSDDPHGTVVDMACRMLGHCSRSQIAASQEVCQALTLAGDEGFGLGGESVLLPIRGVASGVTVREVIPSGDAAQGIRPRKYLDLRVALPRMDVLKMCDESIFAIGRKTKATYDAAGEVSGVLKRSKRLRLDEKQQARQVIWNFLTLLFEMKPKQPESDLPAALAPSTGKTHGWLVNDIVELMSGVDVDIRFYENMLRMHPLPLERIKSAFDEYTSGASGQETKERIIVRNEVEGSLFRDLVAAIETYAHDFHIIQVELHESIDQALRGVVGMQKREAS